MTLSKYKQIEFRKPPILKPVDPIFDELIAKLSLKHKLLSLICDLLSKLITISELKSSSFVRLFFGLNKIDKFHSEIDLANNFKSIISGIENITYIGSTKIFIFYGLFKRNIDVDDSFIKQKIIAIKKLAKEIKKEGNYFQNIGRYSCRIEETIGFYKLKLQTKRLVNIVS